MYYGKSYREELNTVIQSIDWTSYAGKSILITGCNGLICSALADVLMYANRKNNLHMTIYLAARNVERTRERFAYFSGDAGVCYVKYDALNPVEFDFRAEYIIHGASNAHPASYSKEPVETLLVNVTGTEALLRYAREKKAERVLYISSSEVYGKKDKTLLYKEEDYGFVDLLNPRACYPSGKRAAETLCAAYREEYGVDVVIVRPGHVFGPTMTEKDTRATAQFAHDVLAGRDILMKSAGTQMRSYCYSADCATAILTVLLKGKSGEAYNISNRKSVVSIRQIAEDFAKVAGRKAIFTSATDAEQKGYNLMENSSLNAEKLEALGWEALFDCESGVRSMLKIMREERGETL